MARDTAQRLVWLNQPDELALHLDSDEGRAQIDALDVRGNTALHLACMLGRIACAEVLLKRGASLMVKNDLGWLPMHEARSLGNRQLLLAMLEAQRTQMTEYVRVRSQRVIKQLRELDDFYLEMQWDFSSWIPLVSRFCPSDTYRIWKRGSMVRVDTTLVGFENLKWVRGQISFIYRTNEDETDGTLYMVDHTRSLYEVVRQIDDEKKVEDRVNWQMNMAIRGAELQAEKLTISRVKGGFMGMGNGRNEKVGEYEAEVHQLSNVKLRTRVRNEHLDPKWQGEDAPPPPVESDMSRLLAEVEQAESSGEEERKKLLSQFEEKKDADVDKFYHNAKAKALRYRPSLLPPTPPAVSFQEYFFPETADPPQARLAATGRFAPLHVGRAIQQTDSTRSIKATLWMSTTFPMFIEQLLPLLEIMAPSNEHFARLKEFVELRLPRGFPVKLEIPLFGVLTAKITFQNHRHDPNIDPKLFEIDPAYTEGEIKFQYD